MSVHPCNCGQCNDRHGAPPILPQWMAQRPQREDESKAQWSTDQVTDPEGTLHHLGQATSFLISVSSFVKGIR